MLPQYSSQVKIDDIDEKIIRALQREARTNFVDIAKDCGVSIDTISKRFKKMKRNGIVKGTTLLLKPAQFGHNCVASLGIDVSFPYVSEVVELVRKIPDVVFCASSMGKHDIFAIAVLEDVNGLGKVKESLKGYPFVKDVTASIWIDETQLCPENFDFEHIKKK